MALDIVKIPYMREGNDWWPLPPDYPSLTKEGQRQARVNACRQWALPTTMDQQMDRALNFIGSMQFFERHYLWPDEQEEFDPAFFDMPPFPTPEPHLMMYREWAIRKLSLVVAPRGSMKSSASHKSVILQLLSVPQFSITYASSTYENSVLPAQKLKDQINNNDRINDDWVPEYERLKPRRGDAAFSETRMYLGNGSLLKCISALSRARGGRPQLFILDDPEWDPKASTDMTLLRAGMEHLIFTTIRPMLTRPRTSLRWIATIISKKHYAWKAIEMEDTPEGPRAVDPRFNRWSRTVLDVIYKDENGNDKSFCPEMWPLTVADKLADPKLAHCDSLEEIEEEMGTAKFMAEMRAKPGSFEGGFFPEHTQEKHGWWLEDVDGAMGTCPARSKSTLCWYDAKGELKRQLLQDFLTNSCRIFQTADSSYTSTSTSDPKATVVMAITSDNILFVFDMWNARCIEDMLIKESLRLADKWLVPILAPEAIKGSWSFVTNLDAVIRQREMVPFGITHMPVLKPLRPPQNMDKTSKISGMLYRWNHGLIKLPLWLRSAPHWRDFFNQVEGFNPLVQDGGLANDDLLDCVAMSNQVIRWRLPTRAVEEVLEQTPIELIKAGQFTDQASGLPNAAFLNWDQVGAEQLLDIANSQERHHDAASVV